MNQNWCSPALDEASTFVKKMKFGKDGFQTDFDLFD